MPKIAFSDVKLRSILPPEKGTADYWDEKFPAFGLRVSQGGAKTFVLNINKTRRAIGRYPILSLAEARTEARRLLAEKTLGKVRPQSITYEQAKALFLEEKKRSRRERTHTNHEQRLKHFGFHCQLADVSHQDIGRKLTRIKTKSEHDHALSVIKTFFTWATKRRYITDNPTFGFSPFGHTSRARVLTDEELGRIWACITKEPLSRSLPANFARIVQLLILTGQRRSEIASLQTSWITTSSSASLPQRVLSEASHCYSSTTDLWTITLPSSVTKNGREHSLPLGTLAVSLLKSLDTFQKTPSPSRLLFPAASIRNLNGQQAPFSGWSKSKAALDKLSGVTDWRLHDCRRSFASNMARLGVQLPVIERLLNHRSGSFSGIVGVYQRYDFMTEMRDAVDKYERWFVEHVLQSNM